MYCAYVCILVCNDVLCAYAHSVVKMCRVYMHTLGCRDMLCAYVCTLSCKDVSCAYAISGIEACPPINHPKHTWRPTPTPTPTQQNLHLQHVLRNEKTHQEKAPSTHTHILSIRCAHTQKRTRPPSPPSQHPHIPAARTLSLR